MKKAAKKKILSLLLALAVCVALLPGQIASATQTDATTDPTAVVEQAETDENTTDDTTVEEKKDEDTTGEEVEEKTEEKTEDDTTDEQVDEKTEDDTDDSQEEASEYPQYYKVSKDLYVRPTYDATDATYSNTLGKLSAGTVITVLDIKTSSSNNKDWGKIEYNGSYGWCCLYYCVKTEAPAATDSSTDTDASESESEKKENTVTVTTYTYTVTASSLNVRKGAGSSYASLGTVKKGTELTVTEISGNWGKIDYNGKTGWVSLSYCKKVSTNTTEVVVPDSSDSTDSTDTGSETTTAVKYVVNAGSLNVRDSASSSGSSLGKLTKGTTVEVTEVKDGWGKITYNNQTGWISLSYCTKASDSTDTSDSDTTDSETSTSSVKYKVLADELNVRATASTSGELLGTLTRGKLVDVYEVSNNWGKIKYNGSYAWISLNYCSKVVDSESTDSSAVATSGGWKKVSSTWTWYDSNGNKKFADNNMYTAWTKIQSKASGSKYYIVVNYTACRVYVFVGSANNWTPYYLWKCSPGASSTPTPKGNFTVSDRGYSFGTSSYTCYYWTRFYGSYLFHSVLYYANTFKIKNGTLGYHLSHGCVRLAIDNAKYIYNYVPAGTKVLIY